MADFIGALGGLLMITLIVVLFFRFLLDIGVDKDKVYRKQIAGFAIPAVVIALLQLMYGALVSNFVSDCGTVFDINVIWNMKPVSDTSALVSDYSSLNIFENGVMPLYYILSDLMGSVLYEAYDQCALYISFLSGIITYVALGMIVAGSNRELENGDKKTNQMFTLLICVPGSIFLFLPSGFALGMALLCVFLYVWNSGKGNKIVAAILAVICCLTHLTGFCAVAVYIMGYIFEPGDKKSGIRDTIVICLTELVIAYICCFNGWGSLPEYVIVFGIAAILGINNLKYCINYAVLSTVNVIAVLVNGFWITGMLYGVTWGGMA